MYSVARLALLSLLVGSPPCFEIVAATSAEKPEPVYAEIQVVDDATGRGVPLVELETVNHLRFVTDSAGRVAFYEPGLMGQPIFFHVRSHGYEFPKDGFGYAGKALTLTAGETVTLRLKRVNLAERLYRITGEGIYRDSVLLGRSTPLQEPLGSGMVAGQDSTFAVPFGGKIYWFWGDTSRMRYPLGHFWMAGAVSDPPGSGGLDPAVGVNLRYFVEESGFSRPVCRLGVKEGLIWSDAFAALPDETGRERLVCHYAHMKSLGEMFGHGLALYDEEREEFERVAAFELEDRWRWPGQAHPVRYRDGDEEYLLLGEVFPTSRVPARWEDFQSLERYEAWTCLAPGSTPREPKVDRDSEGLLRWRWRRDGLPVDAKLEAQLIRSGQIRGEEARYNPVDVDSGERVLLARGSVSWNPYRQRWIVIAGQQGGASNLGEIWYAEAPEPTGPWLRAKKIVTHDAYSFYNPVHHPFFDQEGGRLVYFEGTYVTTFSGNPVPTPRYDYNQIQYRLDLSDPRLRGAQSSEPGRSPSVSRSAQAGDEAGDGGGDGAGDGAGGLEWIRLSKDGADFVRGDSGERFLAWGVNYDHDGPGRLLEEYWRDEWPTVVEDFREIQALGANVVRIHLQVARFMDGPKQVNGASLERLQQLVRLAEERELYLDLTGLGCYHEHPEWYKTLGESERWDVQVRFWEAIARTCKDSPAVFCYDLMNEPILPGPGKPETEWLTGLLSGKYFVQRLALDLGDRTREEVARAWVDRMVAAIRAHDDRHLITVGVIPWAQVFPGAKPLFYAPEVGEKLDFVSVHFYPEKGKVAEALTALAVYDVGKPLVVEEMFPLKCGIDDLDAFIDGSRRHADGWVSFYWGTTIDEYRSKESPTIADAIIRSWLEHFSKKSPDVASWKQGGP